MTLTRILMSVAAIAAGSAPAGAQDFPTGPITAIVAYGAGGGTDVATRALARHASDYIGQEIVVENRTGGAGAVGMTALAQARPDGYTIGAVNFELLTFQPLERAPIGPEDYRMIMKLQASPSAVTVRTDSPWETIEELVEHARANPGSVRVAASPAGTSWNVAAGFLQRAADIEVNTVPFDGGAQALAAILGGQVDATTISVQEVIDQVRAGDLRILATMTDARHPATPEVPTMQEAGFDVAFGSWTAIAAPRDVPDDVYDILATAMKEMYDDPRFQEFAEENGLTLDYIAGPEFEVILQEESAAVIEILRSQGHIN